MNGWMYSRLCVRKDGWIIGYGAIIWLNVRAISRQVLYTLRPIHPLALSDDSYTFCHNEADLRRPPPLSRLGTGTVRMLTIAMPMVVVFIYAK